MRGKAVKLLRKASEIFDEPLEKLKQDWKGTSHIEKGNTRKLIESMEVTNVSTTV